ncbi:Regulator of competence-specific genes [Kluyvera intermedia]|nr:Regulator of competence-specific genes [Kluyvera intermedia]
MKVISYKRIYQSQEYFAVLGKVRSRALFGGYSLAVDDTVFAMVAEGGAVFEDVRKNRHLSDSALAAIIDVT